MTQTHTRGAFPYLRNPSLSFQEKERKKVAGDYKELNWPTVSNPLNSKPPEEKKKKKKKKRKNPIRNGIKRKCRPTHHFLACLAHVTRQVAQYRTRKKKRAAQKTGSV